MAELTRELLRDLPKNGPTDPIEYYRRPLVGWLFRERINMGLRLLGSGRAGSRRFEHGLEVGYGAGAVLLAMAGVADRLSGLDLDADPAVVDAILARRDVKADLRKGSVLEMPFDDGAFDLVVCFSVFEHLREYGAALREVRRTMRPGGRFLLGMPAGTRMMEWGFLAIGFKGIDDHHVTPPVRVARAFDEAGFRLLDVKYLGVPRPRAALYTTWLLEPT